MLVDKMSKWPVNGSGPKIEPCGTPRTFFTVGCLLCWQMTDCKSLWITATAIPEMLFLMQACICVFVMACYPGYSAPGTPTANRFVGLSPRDPAFLHQQQVRSPPCCTQLTCSSYPFIFCPLPISPHIRCEIPALCKSLSHCEFDL